MTGSRIHMPKYPSSWVIKAAATTFNTSSIMLARTGTTFLPTLCRLALRTSSAPRIEKNAAFQIIYIEAVSCTFWSVVPVRAFTIAVRKKTSTGIDTALQMVVIYMLYLIPFFTLSIFAAP